MSWPSLSEILVILILVILFFGAKRLPHLGAGLGKALRNFKDSLSGKNSSDTSEKK